MLTGYYTAASGMLTQEHVRDVLSNNLVNVRTPGYKADRVISSAFGEELVNRKEAYSLTGIGPGTPADIVTEVTTIFTEGSLEESDRVLDTAINGDGYYVARDGQGNSYLTRNGSFEIDAGGFLCVPGTGRIQGQYGDIQITGEDIRIRDDGTIFVDGEEVDRLQINVPAQGANLVKLPNGLYQAAGSVPVQGGNTYVMQNYLERSNVDLNQEYVRIMEAQRAFNACSSALKIADSMNERSATQIASV